MSKIKYNILINIKTRRRNIVKLVKQKLIKEVEGTWSGKYGFIFVIKQIDNIGKCFVQHNKRDYLTYPVEFKAVVFRPFKSDMLDTLITNLNKVGLEWKSGPMTYLLSTYLVSNEFIKNKLHLITTRKVFR
jgi:DNA-directed RNA polymerase II subunit RPB7